MFLFFGDYVTLIRIFDGRSKVENGRTKLIVIGQIVHTLFISNFIHCKEATWKGHRNGRAIRPCNTTGTVLLKGKGHGVRDCLVANETTRIGNGT